ncbi:acyl-CoA dehydrogenase family protein [Streptomyces sp. NY05-11A]|uniref:acyl-CoA dehydrogenase family protein n=1 Tax=Streptomyces soliscabiei TaxID=588897 RepID=UPI0029A6A6F9|nr:acyl-CoA dehydrogenase [Streptomyces sp. NY05-11A]MDX2678255.1 acyl-CoA dehydrogenase [Streptomyces sp. NY05-11A]
MALLAFHSGERPPGPHRADHVPGQAPTPGPAKDVTAPDPNGDAAADLIRPGDPARADAATARELTRLLFDQDGQQERVHAPWRRLITRDTFRHQPGLTPEQRAAQSYAWLRLVNDTLDDPEALATDPALLTALHEWAAIVDGGGGLTTVASIHYNLFLGSLLDHDDSPLRNHAEFTTLRRIGTFLCTEVDHGNDAPALETTATLDPETGGFVLHTPHPGAAKFMPNTSTLGGPKSAVVAARLLIDGRDQGVFLFLTPLTDRDGPLPHITVTPLPLRPNAPVDHCLTSFDHLPLPRQALLQGEHGRLNADNTLTSALGNRRKRFLTSIARVTAGKLCMSAAAIGASRAALAIAVQYGNRRQVSGSRPGLRIPVNSHRTHHSRLLQAVATTYAMTLLHRSLTTEWSRHTTDDRDHVERLIALTKAWITWQARTITLEARERCGAQGLLPANHLAGFPEYVEGTITAEGDNLLITTKAAAELLLHPPAALLPDAGPPHLTNPRHLRNLLARTEQAFHAQAHSALRHGPAHDPQGRWNTASTPALQRAQAHTTVCAADALLATLARTGHQPTHRLLTELTTLYLLTHLTPHTGTLLADNHIAPHHVHQLPSTVDALTHSLQPHLTTLTEAFDLPPQYLDALPLIQGGDSQHSDGDEGAQPRPALV